MSDRIELADGMGNSLAFDVWPDGRVFVDATEAGEEVAVRVLVTKARLADWCRGVLKRIDPVESDADVVIAGVTFPTFPAGARYVQSDDGPWVKTAKPDPVGEYEGKVAADVEETLQDGLMCKVAALENHVRVMRRRVDSAEHEVGCLERCFTQDQKNNSSDIAELSAIATSTRAEVAQQNERIDQLSAALNEAIRKLAKLT